MIRVQGLSFGEFYVRLEDAPTTVTEAGWIYRLAKGQEPLHLRAHGEKYSESSHLLVRTDKAPVEGDLLHVFLVDDNGFHLTDLGRCRFYVDPVTRQQG